MQRQIQENCDNISLGIKESVQIVVMSSCSGTILSIFCGLREIQRCYCRLYLGIEIYRQIIRIIFGAHIAHNLLWNTLTILHTPVSHLLNLNSSFLYPYKDSEQKFRTRSEGKSYLAVIAQQNESHHLLPITSFSPLLLKFRNHTLKKQEIS